jgi:hypothetical protein
MLRETAAPRNFDPAYDRCGSFASDQNASDSGGMSASPRKRTNSGQSRFVRFVPQADSCHWNGIGTAAIPRIGVNVSRFAAEGEYYWSRWTVRGFAGYETVHRLPVLVCSKHNMTGKTATTAPQADRVCLFERDRIRVLGGLGGSSCCECRAKASHPSERLLP